jgi:hypothetical protein
MKKQIGSAVCAGAAVACLTIAISALLGRYVEEPGIWQFDRREVIRLAESARAALRDSIDRTSRQLTRLRVEEQLMTARRRSFIQAVRDAAPDPDSGSDFNRGSHDTSPREQSIGRLASSAAPEANSSGQPHLAVPAESNRATLALPAAPLPVDCRRIVLLDDQLIENLRNQRRLSGRTVAELRAIIDSYEAEVQDLRNGLRLQNRRQRRQRILTGVAVAGSFALGLLASSR